MSQTLFHLTEYISRFRDTSLAMLHAVRDVSKKGGILVVDPGVYDFYPDYAENHYCTISNNDSGIKKILMPFYDAKNVTIKGNEAKFILHGQIMPAVFDRCENITFENLIIDYKRPFFSEGSVVSYMNNLLELKIDKDAYPYHIHNGLLFFDGYQWSFSKILNLLNYNPNTGNLVNGAGDWYVFDSCLPAEETERGTVLLNTEFCPPTYQIHEGDRLVFGLEGRILPGLFGNWSKKLQFNNVTVHHAQAMAFIFQCCEDVSLTGCQVIPAKGRMISAGADASHFVNCTGTVKVENCVFKGQMDDATNVHGIYTVIQKISGNKIYTKFTHYQQTGVPIYAEGDRISFVKRDTMMRFSCAVITNVEIISKDIVCLTLNQIPDSLQVYDSVENDSRMPSKTLIQGCLTGDNRARGFLLSVSGDVLVENNEFHSNGSAIYISGDSNYWYESGPVEKIEICGNRFVCCNKYPGWGRAVIDVVPEIPCVTEQAYHNTISIHDNEFLMEQNSVVYARSVKALFLENNQITYISGDLPEESETITAEYCGVVHTGNNSFSGDVSEQKIG